MISSRVLCHTYDLKDQLLTATQESGEKSSTSSYTYDSVGNVTSVTNGKDTSYSYDQLSNLVERRTSLGDEEANTYNVNNQLEKVTKSDGKSISRNIFCNISTFVNYVFSAVFQFMTE